MKVLRIADNPLINTECWTYYRFAILQTSPYFRQWLLGHMNLYMYDNCKALFGEAGDIYPLTYYSSILKIEECSIFNQKPALIIDIIKYFLDSEKYVILYVNQNRILNPSEESVWLHEILIHGYDNNSKAFWVSVLRNGHFKSESIPFDVIQMAYQDIYEYFLKDSTLLFERRRFFYGITIISLQPEYINHNSNYEFVVKLSKELHGEIANRQELDDEGEVSQKGITYEGLFILSLLSKKCKEAKENPTAMNDLCTHTSCFLKLCEYQKLILIGMEYFVESNTFLTGKLCDVISEYAMCCETLNKVNLMYRKFQISSDSQILDRIANELDAVEKKERKVINDFISIAKAECSRSP